MEAGERESERDTPYRKFVPISLIPPTLADLPAEIVSLLASLPQSQLPALR